MKILSLLFACAFFAAAPVHAGLFGDTKLDASSGEKLAESWSKADKSLSEADKHLLYRAMVRHTFPRDTLNVSEVLDSYSPQDQFVDLYHQTIVEDEGYDTESFSDLAYSIMENKKERKAIDGKTAQDVIAAFKANEKTWLESMLPPVEAHLKKLETRQVTLLQEIAANQAAANTPDTTRDDLKKRLADVQIKDVRVIWNYSPAFPPYFKVVPDTLVFSATNNGKNTVKTLDVNLQIMKKGQNYPDIDENYTHSVDGGLKPGETREFVLGLNDKWWASAYTIMTEPKLLKSEAYTMVRDNGSHGQVMPTHVTPVLALNDLMDESGQYLSLALVRQHYRGQIEALADPKYMDRSIELRKIESQIPAFRQSVRQLREDMKLVDATFTPQPAPTTAPEDADKGASVTPPPATEDAAPVTETAMVDEGTRKRAGRNATCTDSGRTMDQCHCMEMGSMDHAISLIELEWFYLKSDKLTADRKAVIETLTKRCG